MSEITSRIRPMVLDTGTSSDAAALQSKATKEHAKAVIMSLLVEHGPMTDEELVERYRERAHAYSSVPLITPQSVRTRRHELVVAGLVRDANMLGLSALGNRATVWTLA